MVKKMAQLLLASLVVAFSLVSTVMAQESGTVSGTGRISVDGALVQSGARVTRSSTVYTDADGDGVLDLGALGRITLRPNTSIKLNLSAGGGEITIPICGSMSLSIPQGVAMKIIFQDAKRTNVSIKQGEIEVEYQNKKRTLTAVRSRNFYDTKSVTANSSKGESVFTINCCQCCFVEKVNP